MTYIDPEIFTELELDLRRNLSCSEWRMYWDVRNRHVSSHNNTISTDTLKLENLSLRVEVLEQWMTRCQDRGVIASD